MNFFAISCVSVLLSQKYRKLCAECRIPMHEVASSEDMLKESVSEILENNPYVPSPYCTLDYHGQLQTSVQFVLRNYYLTLTKALNALGLRPPIISYDRELFVLSDGATIGLDWASLPNSTPPTESYGIVLIQHGLGGGSFADHVVFQAHKLLSSGFEVIVFNARGCGGVPLTTNGSYAGNRSKDLDEVITYLKQTKAKDKHLYLMGFSWGAAATLRYLGAAGSNAPLVGAAAVCPPWDLANMSKMFFLWTHLVATMMKLYIAYHRDTLRKGRQNPPTLPRVLMCNGMEGLDSLLYEGYGYKSVSEYHKDASPAFSADTITVPTLAISSSDDPVCGIDAIPNRKQRSSGLVVVKTKYGGHLGFPNGILPLTTSWTEGVVVDWFKQCHKRHAH